MGEQVEQSRERLESGFLATEREAIAHLIHTTAATHRGEGLALLALLRLLETLHQEIRESLFQEALPQNRQALYAMLKDMEAEGGWPYISRMKLRSLLENFPEADWLEEFLEE